MSTEWNDNFFAARGVHITWTYVADLEEGPSSSLCPNCYPQATNVSRARGPGRYDSTNAPIPVSRDQPTQQTIKRRPVPQNSWPYGSPQTSSAGTGFSPVTVPGGFIGQGINQARMAFPESYQQSASRRSHPVTWAAQMTSIAQQYAAKISNQAQEYGRAMEESAMARSRQVEMYSRRVEQDTLARARQIEAMAISKGQRIEQAGDRIANWASNMGKCVVHPRLSPTPTDHSYDQSTYDFTYNNNLIRQQQPRSRRQSNASDTSISSILSIDTVSSVSDLEPDDLESIRAQLSTLDEYHHHELYDAAVSLRSQLETMKKSRYSSRFRSHHVQPWGRWESPEEVANRERRRVAMKRESKLLREKFNEIERRAKREVRDLQKVRKEMKKRQRLRPSSSFMSEQSLHAEPQRSRGMPDRTVSDTNANSYKANYMGLPESLDRTISEPIHQVASVASIPPPSPSITSSTTSISTAPATATAAPVNPHEAAKAWTEAQRQRVKEIQKANKERIKEIQKSYKEREKQQRKPTKKLSKQKHATTTFSGLYSSSSASLQTGTARVETRQTVVEDDDAVEQQAAGTETGTRTRETPSQERGTSEAPETYIAELDGTTIERRI